MPIKARVESKADFGIFLSFDNGESNKGLLHNSQIRKVNLRSDDSQFSIGKMLDVYIQNVNVITKKISFSLRQVALNHQPLENKITISYNELEKLEGSIVEGKVTNIKEYGVFVEICEGVTGLLHISNLKYNGFEGKSVEKYFQKDKEINVAIISVDAEKKRIELRYIK